MPKYIAKQSIGHFRPGDEIKGLEAKQLQALLASGAIEEPEEPKVISKSNDEVDALKAEITDLKAKNKALEDEKAVSDKEITDLKARVIELEKTIAKATQKPVAEK
ncbi:hypothetical protein ACG94V_12470 [Acinetobacter sp. ULE_I001]|uniref:hypothetical protein n=1 Tax=Acinetobacter TaxID=469 RepID=UPI0028D623E2|nr:hypothetical protein [Acinetobacter guillouiae]